jgi:hypothetical protein
LRQELLQVERDVPVDAIAGWTDDERQHAHAWAAVRLEEMLGNLRSNSTKLEPECVQRSATMPLKADEWTSDAPRVDDDGVQRIHAAAEGAR